MNPHYRLKALTHYPDWHGKPLRLSIAEIDDPWLVFEEFFDMYDLPNVRDILELWLNDTIDAGSEDLSKHIHTRSMFEKLAEAAFLLHQQKEGEENRETAEAGKIAVTGSESGDENDEEEKDQDIAEGTGRKPFAKKPFWQEGTGSDPVKAFAWVFTTEDLDTLKETIGKWCTIALTNERANYKEAVLRAGLLAFCDELAKLADAAYCIHRIHAIEKRSGFSLSNPVNLQPEILQKENSLRLSYEELLHPEQVLDRFCRLFTPAYIRAELWDLLDSVICANSNEIERNCLLLHYQCLLTLTQAARRLHYQRPAEIEKQPNEVTVKKEPE